jgi:hypothetical protein
MLKSLKNWNSPETVVLPRFMDGVGELINGHDYRLTKPVKNRQLLAVRLYKEGFANTVVYVNRAGHRTRSRNRSSLPRP